MSLPGRWRAIRRLGVVVALVMSILGRTAWAANPNQYGGQDRADAASELIVLGVQRGIDSLPLISGQSVTYEFDSTSDAPGRTTRLGPTVLPSSQVVEPGTFAVQCAASYFELAQTFQPINYLFDFSGTPAQQGVSKLGLKVDAKVGLLNISATYGISSRIEVDASVPITIVDAQASEIFPTYPSDLSVPPQDAQLAAVVFPRGQTQEGISALNGGLKSGQVVLRTASLSSLGFDFNDGTHVGLGRISLGGKAVVLSTPRFQLALYPQLLMPSPSQNEFSGPDSAAIFPQVAATVKVMDALRWHSSVGYDYDFNHDALRSFTWRSGGSFALQAFELDLGFGGSEYDSAIQWTPNVIHGQAPAPYLQATGYAVDKHTTGTSLVDILLGGKVRVAAETFLSGGVSIPIVSPGFQPDALGTIAIERVF